MKEESEQSGEYEAPALVAEELVIFPHLEVSVTIKGRRNKAALEASMRGNALMVATPVNSSGTMVGDMGVLVLVQESVPDKAGAMRAHLKGLWRVAVEEVVEGKEYTKVRFAKAEKFADGDGAKPEIMQTVLGQIDEFVKLIPGIPMEIIHLLRMAKTPDELADLCAYSPQFTFEDRLDLLKTLDPEERLGKISALFDKQLAALNLVSGVKTISDCDKCADLADQAIEGEESRRLEYVYEFLQHVVQDHTGEVVALLAERYGPVFMKKRALK